MQIKNTSRLIFSWSLLFLSTAAFSSEPMINNSDLWKQYMLQSVDFFNRNAWDHQYNSYASEINVDGSKKSDTRYLIALSRMIYGLSYSSAFEPENLIYAKKSAEFILQHMVRRDQAGPYFLSAVDAHGNDSVSQTILEISEQAYGLNGLVALYQVTKDPELLQFIREAYTAFYTRFHDDTFKGFYDKYDLNQQKPIYTKSYNSTVYVATSFLLDLSEADIANRESYLLVITELADLVSTYFPDKETGWIVENFTSDWQPDWRDWQKQGEFTIGIVGHNFQAAWLLMRIAELIPDQTKSNQYKNIARSILTSMLSKPVIDRKNGGFFDAYKRETNETMWNTNKAWWQQAEGILALTFAVKNGLLADRDAVIQRDKAVDFYFKHFVDHAFGGEFDVVDQSGMPVAEAMKGHRGKSTYHSVELAKYMMKYSGFQGLGNTRNSVPADMSKSKFVP